MKNKNAINLIFSANAIVAILFILLRLNNSLPYSSKVIVSVSILLLVSSLLGVHALNKKYGKAND